MRHVHSRLMRAVFRNRSPDLAEMEDVPLIGVSAHQLRQIRTVRAAVVA
jgi:hypothetical protein